MNKRVLYSLWTLVSVLLFFWILFPGEFAAELIKGHANRMFPNAEVSLEGVGLAVPFGLTVKKLAVGAPGLSPVAVQALRLTPSWLTLVSLSPGADLSASLFGGRVALSGRSGYKGGWRKITAEVESVDLSTLSPFVKGRLPVAFTLSGKGEAALDLARDKEATGEGTVRLEEVTLGFSDSIIPFEKLTLGTVTAEVAVKGTTVTVSSLHVDGTELDAELRGSVVLSTPISLSRVTLSGTVSPAPAFVSVLTDRVPLGMLMDPKLLKRGRIPLRISGTLGAPDVSFK